MGTFTQTIDYLTRKPEDFTLEFVKDFYTHITITPELKRLRRELKLYRKEA